MESKIKQLKTTKCVEKDRMVDFLLKMVDEAKEDKIASIIMHIDSGETIETEVLGDLSSMEAIGIIDTSKFAIQISLLDRE